MTELQSFADITFDERFTPDRRSPEGGDRRRNGDRRREPRGGVDRRRGERRKNHVCSMMLTAAIMSVPANVSNLAHQVPPLPVARAAQPASRAVEGSATSRSAERGQPGYTASPTARSQSASTPADRRARGIEAIIADAGRKHGVPVPLIREVIRAESGFNAKAKSPAGAMGLMQIMPPIAKHYGAVDPFDPRQNVFAGVRYLSELLDRYRGDVKLALASYNAGPTAVARYRGVPPYPETRNYVRKILTRLPQYNTR